MSSEGKTGIQIVCPRCLELLNDPCTRHACASVGIEHGKSTDRMLFEYLSGEHKKGGDGHEGRMYEKLP